LNYNLLPVHAVAIKKNILIKAGKFDVSLKSAEDWDLWVRIYKVGGKLGIIDKVTAIYRISDNSMSRQYLTMYTSLKIVSTRAFSFDSRISSEFTSFVSYKNQHLDALKKLLIMCLGVAIFQGKVEEAINLFSVEQKKYNFSFLPADFRIMCSYLTFRYETEYDDVQRVFLDIYPFYFSFFTILKIKGLNLKATLDEIFYIHYKLRNKHKWGFFSPFINWILWN
jgi:hypothetical protein